MKDTETMLKLMRFWLFGTFLILIVAFTVFAGVIGTGLLILKQPLYWVFVVVTAVLCAAVFYIYKWYLEKKE